jgi:hypothetical protein
VPPLWLLADGLDQICTLKAYSAFPLRSSLSDLISSNRPHAISCFDRVEQRGYPPLNIYRPQ